MPLDILRPIWLRLFLLASLILSGVSCSDGKAKSGGGVVDGGGGGDFIYTEPDEVRKVIAEAWGGVVSQNIANPLLRAHEILRRNDSRTTEEEQIFTILKAMLSGEGEIPKIPLRVKRLPEAFMIENMLLLENLKFNNLQYLQAKQLKLEDRSMCSGPNDHQFLASVTKLNREGEICISVHGLTQLPSGSLKRDLIALMAHEIAHLNGADEDLARKVQRFFLKSMPQLLRERGDEVKWDLLEQYVDRIMHDWTGLIAYEVISPELLDRMQKMISMMSMTRIPHPYVGPELNLKQPQDYKRINRQLVDMRTKLARLRYKMVDARKRDLQAKMTSEYLLELREVITAIMKFYEDYHMYLMGTPAAWGKEPYDLIDRATNPETLTRPDLRPNLENPF
ncbi:MAG: hypothetical protein AB7F86_18150 [Bdellovibrionales bacterium]